MQQDAASPLVSIAMVTYNGEAYLSEQLDSILAQTYPYLDIIISDDGSTDDTLKILEEYTTLHENIRVVKNEGTKGFKGNAENAIRHCKGEWIALSDQDDTWLPEKIATMMKATADCSLVYHNSLFVNETGDSLRRTMAEKFHFYSGHNPEVFLLNNCVSGHALMFHRKLAEIALPFPNARFHDWWLAFVATDHGGVKYIDQILVHYRQHQRSETDILLRKSTTRHQKEFIRFTQNLEWYNQCAKIAGTQHPFFVRWAKQYARKPHQWLSAWLFFTAFRKRETLYVIPRKNALSKFSLILHHLWGLRLKKLVG